MAKDASSPAASTSRVWTAWSPGEPLRLFAVAGEHSGDRLGGKLLAALRQGLARQGSDLCVRGVGAEDMLAQALEPLFPMSDIAVMGFGEVIKRLPLILTRLSETVAAARSFAPHVLLIIDSPDFTHRVARRLRRQVPALPIIDYVSPTVWAWRPGRARAMAAYVDHLLALLPFEPEAHARVGGPPCTYVGHPIAERLAWIRSQDGSGLARRLGLAPSRPVIVVLPGSRRGIMRRLLPVFRGTMALVSEQHGPVEAIMPTVAERREELMAATADWPMRTNIVTGEADKFAAFRLANAALAASGTVTLELAAAGTPTVVAYKVEPWMAPFLRRMIKGHTVVLPNLILGDNALPELLQEDCTPERLASALGALLEATPARDRQLEALARIPQKLTGTGEAPSEIGARIVLDAARYGRGSPALR